MTPAAPPPRAPVERAGAERAPGGPGQPGGSGGRPDIGKLETAWREEAPRILGAVARTTGDLLLAEDAVQEAFARALEEAARGRVPTNPAAWITTVARRVALDALRREQTANRAAPALAAELARTERATSDDAGEGMVFTGDERLELILLVAHPDLSAEARVELALRFVCGLPTARIAEVFLVPEATMAARLTRAKKRIHSAGVRFALDDPRDVADRMSDALATIYLLYTVGHLTADRALRADAVALARDAHRIARTDESAGLLALLLFTEARQATRLTADDEFALLRDADRSRWDVPLMTEAEALATAALAGGGRYALQAGIAGLHAIARTWQATDWPAIVRLYDGLVRQWPSPAARLGRVVALGHSPDAGPEVALSALAADPELFRGPAAAQAYAARAELLRLSGRSAEAVHDLRRAVEAAGDERTARSLARLLAAVE
ncbi:sigma-70 family RNA polymerase sigma factor [Leifsonia shinshuensis]|uniref:RNA polymerase sigma factor n=1 Tax=Leifsonia shinshuensis TaxID=150026 RepID=UPI0028624D5E|nr:sigma-70 family RNA polymerase sigma factor [Leifsonia shinshuensis]MDR6970143.1 RNA polymerase sigma-70 factor (ECF subfamily) [Leifsonia shinshuensis]